MFSWLGIRTNESEWASFAVTFGNFDVIRKILDDQVVRGHAIKDMDLLCSANLSCYLQ
jgi:hypothetical protein